MRRKIAEATRQQRAILENHRRELLQQVREQIRSVRAQRGAERDVLGQDERSDVYFQEDLELTLIQMNSETLSKVNSALRRLEHGKYGTCRACGEDIAVARLRAMPFAVRCKKCEEDREITVEKERRLASHRPSELFGMAD